MGNLGSAFAPVGCQLARDNWNPSPTPPATPSRARGKEGRGFVWRGGAGFFPAAARSGSRLVVAVGWLCVVLWSPVVEVVGRSGKWRRVCVLRRGLCRYVSKSMCSVRSRMMAECVLACAL
jgi:hypothetical protein